MCCIEPSESLRLVLLEISRKAGWEAEVCKSLEEAEQAVGTADKRLDLIVTAASLPSGSYHDVLASFRRRAETESLPIVLLSSDTENGQIEKALESGITEVFHKSNLDAFGIYLRGYIDSEVVDVAGKRALVLDDDHALGAYLKTLLAELRLDADLFHDADKALGEASAAHYDLIIADLVLDRNQSGAGFIRLLRQSSGRSAGSPLIAMSGYVDDARRIEALRAGADAFLAKPIIASELHFLAQRLMQRRNVRDSSTPSNEMLNSALASNLSEREQLVCALVAAGHRDKEIARQLGVSFWTVRSHLAHIFKKSGTTNRVELATKVRQRESGESAPHVPRTANQLGEAATASAMDWLHLSAYVMNEIRHGVMVTDRRGTILQVNPAFTEITGFHSDEVLGKTPRFLSSGLHHPGFFRKLLTELETRGTWCDDIRFRDKNGDVFARRFDICRLPPDTPMGAYYVALMAKVDAQGAHADLENLRHAALHDPLTGLANRALLEDRASQEISRAKRSGKRIGIAFIDLDRFKMINDTFGHQRGDDVLKEVAQRFSAVLRSHDTLARQGGDEFVALFPDIDDRRTAGILGRKLLEVFRMPFRLPDDSPVHLGASIGVSLYPDDGAEFEELLSRADSAMYRAKHGGGGMQCYEPAVEAGWAGA